MCYCDLCFLLFDNGVIMLNCVCLEGKKIKVDVVVGIDNFI